MKPPAKIFFTLLQNQCSKIFVAVLLILTACHNSPTPAAGKIVAHLNDIPIKAEEFQQFLTQQSRYHSRKTLDNKKPFQELKELLLDNFLERKILLLEASKKDIRIDQEELARHIAELKTGYTDREFENVLEKQGLQLNQWTDMIHDQQVIDKLIAAEIYAKIAINETEIKKYYETYTAEFYQEEAVRARQIVTDTYEKALHILEKIIKGQNFAKMALDHSLSPDRAQGGDLGYFTRGAFPKEFEETCFRLKPGEISEIVKSPYGYHIFKLMDRRPARLLSVEEVSDQIRQTLFDQKAEEEFKKWKAELFKQYKVTIDEAQLKKIKINSLGFTDEKDSN